MSLTDFLLARIAEDEHAAMAARPDEHHNVRDRSAVTSSFDAAGYSFVRITSGRVARDCAARRRIVQGYEAALATGDEAQVAVLHEVLLALASIHADHADYDESWRV